jgi:RNA polymerase sigma-70 factor (ECF subfamily)
MSQSVHELVVQAQSGDRDAFTALGAIHVDRMYAIASLILRDHDRAEDAVQESLVRAWRDLCRLRDPARVAPWLRTLLVRACYDEARRSRRGADLRLVPVSQIAIADHQALSADRDALERGFRRLSVEHRTAIVLRYFADLTLSQLADAMGVPIGTAKSRLHHAERALRAVLEADARTATRGAGGA